MPYNENIIATCNTGSEINIFKIPENLDQDLSKIVPEASLKKHSKKVNYISYHQHAS
jgi:hypothetical protein